MHKKLLTQQFRAQTVGQLAIPSFGPFFGFIACISFCAAILFNTQTFANANQWESDLKGMTTALMSPIEEGQSVFVSSARDRSPQALYYPFSRRIQEVISSGAINSKGRLVDDSLSADYFIYPGFEVRSDAISLTLELISAADGEMLAKKIGSLSRQNLPAGWDVRAPKDVAHELGMKLEKAIYPEKAKIVKGAMKITNKEGLISEFATTMMAYLGQELRRRKTFDLVTPTQATEGALELRGTYYQVGSEVVMELSLINSASDSVRASVETSLRRQDVPKQVALAPKNTVQANQMTESDDSLVPDGLADVVSLWVNNDPPRYVDGDNLVVSVASKKDIYLRLYYIQSDGLICQIFPAGNNNPGFLRANRPYDVGGINDSVELIISNETQGQETIKAFASLGRIDDSSLPKQFIAAANMSCMTQGYANLQNGITRALRLKHKVRPVAEAQILVTD
jgi:hypothetical protein